MKVVFSIEALRHVNFVRIFYLLVLIPPIPRTGDIGELADPPPHAGGWITGGSSRCDGWMGGGGGGHGQVHVKLAREVCLHVKRLSCHVYCPFGILYSYS